MHNASMLVGLPSWEGLAFKALEELRQKGCLDYSELEQLNGLEPKKQLSIAELIAKENSISLELELPKHLAVEDGDRELYSYLNKIGCPCVFLMPPPSIHATTVSLCTSKPQPLSTITSIAQSSFLFLVDYTCLLPSNTSNDMEYQC